MPELILLQTVLFLHFTHYIKWHDWARGGRCQNAQKQIIIKTY